MIIFICSTVLNRLTANDAQISLVSFVTLAVRGTLTHTVNLQLLGKVLKNFNQTCTDSTTGHKVVCLLLIFFEILDLFGFPFQQVDFDRFWLYHYINSFPLENDLIEFIQTSRARRAEKAITTQRRTYSKILCNYRFNYYLFHLFVNQ